MSPPPFPDLTPRVMSSICEEVRLIQTTRIRIAKMQARCH